MDYILSDSDKLTIKLRTLEFKVERLRQTTDEQVVINTPSGKIKGAQRHSVYNRAYYSFEGIPYAQPPIGDLRFRAPKPLPPWQGIRNCTDYAHRPRQREICGEVSGSEDCLYLNIYTNNIKPFKSRPVLVFLYGGSFVMGEATPEWYGPDYFMKKDVILVTIQYRVGAFGFLSLSDPHLHTPGNAGIKDQILALKWIKRNIGAFGGNAECITVFGEGAGAICTHLLMITEQAKGLFQRAILQSGFLTYDWNFNYTRGSHKLARVLGYKGEQDEKKILKFLQNCSGQEIVEAEIGIKGIQIPFGICIEPYVTQHTVLPRHPAELLEHAWGNTIPLIVGNTSNEGCMLVKIARKQPEKLHSLYTCTRFLPKGTCVTRDSPECLAKGLKLRQLHVRGDVPTDHDFFEMISFASFWLPLQKAIDVRLQRGQKSAATYLYRYDFETKALLHPYFYFRDGHSVNGVAHGDDLSVLFHSILAKRMDPKSREYKTIKRMIYLWTTFAATGNPNVQMPLNIGGASKKHAHVKWHPVRKDSRHSTTWQCLNIGDELSFVDLPEMTKLKVWNELYDQQHLPLPKYVNSLELESFVKSML